MISNLKFAPASCGQESITGHCPHRSRRQEPTMGSVRSCMCKMADSSESVTLPCDAARAAVRNDVRFTSLWGTNPEVFYSTFTTAICQRKHAFYLRKNIVLFFFYYPIILTFNILEHPWNQGSSWFHYIFTSTNSCSLSLILTIKETLKLQHYGDSFQKCFINISSQKTLVFLSYIMFFFFNSTSPLC